MSDQTPSLSDLKFAYYGGGNDAEFAFLLECYQEGITAFDLISLVGGGGGGSGVAKAGAATTLWAGTQAQYDAIGTKDSGTVYVVTA